MERNQSGRSGVVGERLREVRQSQRLSLSNVAEKAGISAATLSRIETDKQSVDLGLFMSIARILKVAAHEILDSDGESDSADGDPIARRVSNLSPKQRMNLWRDLASHRRADRMTRPAASRSLSQQLEELAAQVDFLREEINSVRARVKRRK